MDGWLPEGRICMKNLLVLLVIAVLIGTAVYFVNTQAPQEDLEVVCYLRKLIIPEWVPLSLGQLPGSLYNPVFLELRQDRYLIIVVSVPARILLAVVQDDPDKVEEAKAKSHTADGKKYPEFSLVSGDGRQRKPYRIVAWPEGKKFSRMEDFADKSNWYPQTDEKPDKIFRLGLMWRITKKAAKGPFQLQMDGGLPIEIPTTKFDMQHHWGR